MFAVPVIHSCYHLLKITLLYTFCLTNARQALFMMLYNYFEGSKRSKVDIRMLFHWSLSKQCCFGVSSIDPRSCNILPRKSARYCMLQAACYAGHCRQQQPTGCQIAIKIIDYHSFPKPKNNLLSKIVYRFHYFRNHSDIGHDEIHISKA